MPLFQDFLFELFEIFHFLESEANVNLFNPQIKWNNLAKEDCITLSQIEMNIRKSTYNDDAWLFIEHCSKAFRAIQKSFPARNKIYVLSVECQVIFNDEMGQFMKWKGYCCAQYRVNTCKRIYCSGAKKCIVRNNSGVYIYNTKTYCEKCFDKLPDSDIKVEDDKMAKKSDFNRFTYFEYKPEEMIECVKCNKLQHERCVLHFKQSNFPFICKTCRDVSLPFQRLRLTTKHLPRTELDEFIENYLHKNRTDSIKITIRMLGCSLEKFKPKPVVVEHRPDLFDYPEIYFNNCAIFAFLKQSDDTEICFFGVYCHLYNDPRCPPINRNTAYLSYIDSVKLYEIKQRTEIYQTIIFGLFEYLKAKNFRAVYIWSCPPAKDIDYIFYNKPYTMRIPKIKRLIDWYENLFEKAVQKNIINGYTDAKNYSRRKNWYNLSNIPYFYLDMWPTRIEDMLLEMQKMMAKKELKTAEYNEYFKNWLKVQFDSDGQAYFIVDLGTREFPVRTELINCDQKWITNRIELLDMQQSAGLNFRTERDARFSTFMMLYRCFVEGRICSKCGNRDSTLGFLLVCRRCTKKVLDAYEKRRKETSEMMNLGWTVNFNAFKSAPNGIIDLTADEVRAFVPKITETIDLCDED